MVTGKDGSSPDWERLLAGAIEAHGRWFFVLAYRILRNPDATEDACQRAFVRAWEQKERLRNAQALKAWLARVVVNEALQMRRQAQSKENMHASLVERYQPPEPAHAKLEFEEALDTALEELPEQIRTVVVLRLIHKLSGNEVTALLGCSPAVVSRQLHQGLDHLRGRLSQIYDHA